jgi:hypothetical protein
MRALTVVFTRASKVPAPMTSATISPRATVYATTGTGANLSL